jgi:Carboxypeptidase regulatory-like domain/TonB dependent receptor-like, beta-barrel
MPATQVRALSYAALVVLLAHAFLAPPVHSQAITATLQGAVRDVSHAVLPGATVTLRERNTGFARTATTDAAGAYVLSQLPAGTYDLSVELTGFKTLHREALRFQVGQETTLDIALEIGGVAETLTVSEAAPLVEVTKASVGQTISREQIDNLPLPGRQASSLALLVPGVVQRGTSTEEPVGTGGQPRGSGETLVDGVSTELLAVNSIRSTIPPDAVQEFQVITNQYQAEFGNATGVILNTITRSGTNDLHGRVYYFHRDEGLDARNAFATSKASFEQKQSGGWLGGPIIRDRTHYFLSYEATRRMQIATVTSPVAPGDVEQPFDNNQILGKVTHQFNANNRLTGRFSLDRPVRDNVGVGGNTLEEVGFEQLTEDLSYVGDLTTILSHRALNEVRVQLSDSRSQLDPKRADVFTIIRPSSTSGKARQVPQAFPELRFQIVDNLSYERGSQRIKVGIDFNRVVLGEGYVYQDSPGTFQFATDRPFDAADPSTYPILFLGNEGDPTFKFTSTGVAAFAQDSWRLPRNLTLNIGLRYDAWDVTGLDLQKASFAPRLSAAWDPFGTNNTVVRAGYGLFYNNVLTNVTVFTTFLSGQRSIAISNPGYPDPFSRGTTVAQPLSTYIAQPDQSLPLAHHTTAGLEHEIAPGWSVGADYVNSRGRDLIRIVDTNPPVPPTYTTRIDPTRGFVRILESTGYSNYDALLMSFRGRISSRNMFQVAYTLSSYKTTTESDASITQQDDLNKNDSYGYGDNDQRHRFVFSGYVTLPWEIQLGGVLTARSGVPFNITNGTDNNLNSVANDRPNLAPGARVYTDDMKNRASFINPGRASGDLPRNAGRRPAYWTLDARFAKRFRIGPTSIEGLVEAFNLTNRVNYNGFVGTLGSAQFGLPNTAFDARQVQLGARFEF